MSRSSARLTRNPSASAVVPSPSYSYVLRSQNFDASTLEQDVTNKPKVSSNTIVNGVAATASSSHNIKSTEQLKSSTKNSQGAVSRSRQNVEAKKARLHTHEPSMMNPPTTLSEKSQTKDANHKSRKVKDKENSSTLDASAFSGPKLKLTANVKSGKAMKSFNETKTVGKRDSIIKRVSKVSLTQMKKDEPSSSNSVLTMPNHKIGSLEEEAQRESTYSGEKNNNDDVNNNTRKRINRKATSRSCAVPANDAEVPANLIFETTQQSRNKAKIPPSSTAGSSKSKNIDKDNAQVVPLSTVSTSKKSKTTKSDKVGIWMTSITGNRKSVPVSVVDVYHSDAIYMYLHSVALYESSKKLYSKAESTWFLTNRVALENYEIAITRCTQLSEIFSDIQYFRTNILPDLMAHRSFIDIKIYSYPPDMDRTLKRLWMDGLGKQTEFSISSQKIVTLLTNVQKAQKRFETLRALSCPYENNELINEYRRVYSKRFSGIMANCWAN